ncbi:MAG: hypothetical protein IJ793_01675 [Opitutales bacterium]|nr:hypothetical protein [Opitutales bacterium]
MKINFKTIGIVTAVSTLPIVKTHAWPFLTPEQLKVALEAIQQESTTRSDFPFKIEKIEYASDGLPKLIKGTGITSECIDAALTKHIKPFSLNIKDKANLREAGKRLEALSKELSVEDLKKRDVNTDQLEKLGIKKVREITFDSILESTFFNNAQRGKAKAWLENKEELERAIEDYADNYPYDLLQFQCNLRCETNTGKTNETVLICSCIIPKGEEKICKTDWRLPWRDGFRYVIEEHLKSMLLYKNGKQKVILLLLLDEATPKEDRLKWGYNHDHIDGTFQSDNCITFNPISTQPFLGSHEIGHYLQMHFGLVQTSENYQTKFAKELLLLNNAYLGNPMPIPTEMREYASMVNGSLFWNFDKNYFACPKQLSLNEIFAYVQLLIRWQSTAEISNILGVYFNGNTLYLNALSDIRELKHIRYTHGPKSWGNKIFKDLSTLPKGIQNLLRDIFSKASQMSLPKDMLELLCRLHGRPSQDAQNVVCDFDCKDDEEWRTQVKPVISGFIEAE